MGKDTKATILNQKLSQRDAFWSQVGRDMEHDQDIVIVVADMSSPVFDEIRTKFPHRFINTGIAEQNAVAVAAGLAMKGKKVFVYAIASFMVLRCYEQIRVNCSIMGLPLTIVGVGAGFSYDDSGPTHHLFEDIAIMRVMPKMVVNSISDNSMASAVAHESVSMDTANYVRLERHISTDLSVIPYDFDKGYRLVALGSSGKVIITTGFMNGVAIEIAKAFDHTVIDMYQLPIDTMEFFKTIENLAPTKIITLEESFLPGGLGSYLLECANDAGRILPLTRLGISPNWIYEYGGREANQWQHNLDYQGILRRVNEE